jgi:hypothetical protein
MQRIRNKPNFPVLAERYRVAQLREVRAAISQAVRGSSHNNK